MADLATAYVQIVPSARGMKEGLSSIFGSKMPSAGNSAGGLFSSGLISTIKKAIMAAGIGEALKKTLTEGAALEQSLGGIETLFKDSAATVIANAEQAYKTAGMSANSYMEQVTSFSASLLQSLGGDTAAAAEVANMALIDMSDNANKMGTDMERITDAYQGFAKQNYTMLDNLKLGYGGTKTEMQRLLKDAQKLTGVKYDINNLSDVYNAIHAIQENLEITGTTAKEASSTLTGSFNAMKSAFTDVLGNLALGKAMGPSLNALAETTVTFLTGNLVPAVWNIITALPGSLVTFINALLPADMSSVVSTAVTQFSAFMTANLPTILTQGVQMITQLVTGFLSGIPTFLTTAGSLLNQLLTAILAALPSMLSSGAQLILNLASGLLTSLPSIVSSAASIIAQLLTTFASYLPDLLAQGISLISNLIAGLISMIPDVISAAGDIIKNICNAFGETDWLSIGANIISGIANGIRNGISTIISAAKEAALSAYNAAKEALGIASPSKLFRKEIGYRMPQGAALGIYDGIPLVERAIGSLSDTASRTFTSRLRVGTQYQTAGTDGVAGFGKRVIVNQYIYSEAKTAADLMQEARYQAETAVLLGV